MQDWSNPNAAYLLGVTHGDGNVSTRAIRISIGYKEVVFAKTIMSLWKSLGFNPHLYERRTAFSLEVCNTLLANEMRKLKTNGKWRLPENINKAEWLAGIFDTDGCVSLASRKCSITIGLKRSGNLLLVKKALSELGIANVNIRNGIKKFNGEDYPYEVLGLTSFAKLKHFSATVPLKHPRKKERLKETIDYINHVESITPLWKQVSEWIHQEPKSWLEISQKFNLTKKQVDSCLQLAKKHGVIEITPPPKMLTKYFARKVIK
jgi:intein/homing endonuclease